MEDSQLVILYLCLGCASLLKNETECECGGKTVAIGWYREK